MVVVVPLRLYLLLARPNRRAQNTYTVREEGKMNIVSS